MISCVSTSPARTAAMDSLSRRAIFGEDIL